MFAKIFLIHVLSLLLTVVQCDKLLLVQTLMNHGAISPETTYFTSPYKGIWPPGTLLSKGEKEMYNLGKKLGERYIKDNQLLSTNYVENEVNIIATALNRTHESALSMLNGFYSVNSCTDCNDTSGWHLTDTPSINSSLKHNPLYFYECNIAKDLMDYHIKSIGVEKIMNKYYNLRKNLTEYSGDYLYKNELYLLKICDEILLELNIDNGGKHTWQKKFYNICSTFEIEALKLKYEIKLDDPNLSEEIRVNKLKAFHGKLLSEMFDLMKNKYSNYKNSTSFMDLKHLKHLVYSGHDFNIILFSALMDFEYLDVDEDKIPSTSTAFTIELWIDNDDNPYVKLLYWKRDDDTFIDATNKIGGCEDNCTLDKFEGRSVRFIPSGNYDSFCNSRISNITLEDGVMPDYSKLSNKPSELLASFSIASYFLQQ